MPEGSISRSSVINPADQPMGGSSSSGSRSPDSPYTASSDQKTVISKRPLAPPAAPPIPTKPSEVGLSLVGETLGHFRLEEFVGGGGMGAVFRAIDSTLGRTVAVKVVSNQNADEDMLRRFRNEAQSAARLDHPNIARVYYVGEEKGWSYIVFEFIEGVNIRDLVEQQGPLSIEDTIRYTLQITEALEHASERDVVHRDIKPSNILVMPDGRAKLVDMGLARLHQVDSPSQDLTETGVTLGTFDYISPEQARDPRSADVRSDLYSLGCTLYYMLTGSPPFPEGTVLQKLLSHSSDPPPDPRELRPELDDDLANITLRLMAKSPSQRFQSPAEMIDRLLYLSDRLGLPHDRRYTIPTTVVLSSWRGTLVRHIPWIAPAVLLIAAVAVLEMLQPSSVAISREQLLPFPDSASDRVTEPHRATIDEPPAANSVQGSGGVSKTSTVPNPNATQAAEPVSPSVEVPSTASVTDKSSPAASIEPNRVSTAPPPTNDASKSSDNRVPGNARPPEERNPKDTSAPPIDDHASEPTSGGSIVDSTVTVTEPIPATGLIVSSDPPQPDKPHIVGSLDAAFQKLASIPQVDTIELRLRQRVESPLTLAPRSKDSELTIRAGADSSPLIIFRPSSSDSPDRSLFKVIGGKVNFVGLHFRVELGSQAAEDWSLFHLKDTGRVTFTNCTLTIRNDKGGAASFFTIHAPVPSKTMTMMPMGMPEVSTGPTIDLKSCVVRGDANLVRAANGLPFTLNWTQGFLATSRPAILARGLRPNSALMIRLKLANVTGSLGAGLCQIEVDSNAPIVPDLSVQTTGCVWLQLDPEVPLVEHVGIENIEQLTRNLYRYDGQNNFYPSTKILWRIQPRVGEPVDYKFRDPSPGVWYQEASVERGVLWQRAFPAEGRPTYTYSFRDFVLKPEQASMAGFSESFLPEPREPDPETSPKRFDTPL